MDGSSVILQPAVMVGGHLFEQEETAPFLFPLHKHDLISEILLVEEGEGEFAIDGETYRAEAGTLLFYQRGVWHEERSTLHPFRGMYIGFKGLKARGLPANHFLPPGREPFVRLGEQSASFAQSIRSCIEEFRQEKPESRMIGSMLLGVVLARLAAMIHYREPASQQKPSQTVVLHARQYMEENYDKPITLAALSRLTFVNEYYLSHLFKQEMGISPIQFLIRCRIDVARRYLSMSSYTVGQIARLVGYQSETTFRAVFKRIAGVTPQQYREQPEERE